METDLVKVITERVVKLQNDSAVLQQRRNQLISAQTDVDTRIVEIRGAIIELEIAIGRRDENGNPIKIAAQSAETK